MSAEQVKDLRTYKILTLVFIMTSFAFMGLHAYEKGEFMFWTFETPTAQMDSSYETGRADMFMNTFPSIEAAKEYLERDDHYLEYDEIPKSLRTLMEYEKDE